jgi:GT2 family glycosyltransferase
MNVDCCECNVDVTVVIVSYNVAELACEAVASVKQQTSCRFEIIVVDNGSVDNSVARIKSEHPDVIIIENGRNAGFAVANNQAFRIAAGRFLFMLNPDTVVLEGAIDRLVSFMEGHPKIGACGPKVLNPDLSLQYNCHHFPSLTLRVVEYLQLKRFFPRNRFFGREHMTYWDYNEENEVDWMTGCALLIRREALEQVGLLDENYFMYAEESDLCFRLKKTGWRVVFHPEASIIHHGGQSVLNQSEFKALDRTITSYLFSTRYYFFRKNYGYGNCLMLKTLDFLYYGAIYAKNLFRRNGLARQARMQESRAVLSLILSHKHE